MDVEEGVLGTHYVDGPDEEPLYGMYVKIGAFYTFIDLKEDELLKERERHALDLWNNREALAESVNRFKAAHVSFQDSHIEVIGLHSSDVKRGELFWSDGRYTLLHGASLDDANEYS